MMKGDLKNAAAWCMGDERAEAVISDTAIIRTKSFFEATKFLAGVESRSMEPRTGHQRAVSMWDREPSPVRPVVPLLAAPSFTRWPSMAAEQPGSPRSSRKPSLRSGEGEGLPFAHTSMAAEFTSPRSSRKPSLRSGEGEGMAAELTSPRSSRKPSLRSGDGEGLIRGTPSSTSLMSGEEDRQTRSVCRSPSLREVNAGGGTDGKANTMSRSSSLGRGGQDRGGSQGAEEEQMAESRVSHQVHTRDDGVVVHDL